MPPKVDPHNPTHNLDPPHHHPTRPKTQTGCPNTPQGRSQQPHTQSRATPPPPDTAENINGVPKHPRTPIRTTPHTISTHPAANRHGRKHNQGAQTLSTIHLNDICPRIPPRYAVSPQDSFQPDCSTTARHFGATERQSEATEQRFRVITQRPGHKTFGATARHCGPTMRRPGHKTGAPTVKLVELRR